MCLFRDQILEMFDHAYNSYMVSKYPDPTVNTLELVLILKLLLSELFFIIIIGHKYWLME